MGEKNMCISWQRSAIKEVNDLAPKIHEFDGFATNLILTFFEKLEELGRWLSPSFFIRILHASTKVWKYFILFFNLMKIDIYYDFNQTDGCLSNWIIYTIREVIIKIFAIIFDILYAEIKKKKFLNPFSSNSLG